MATPKEMFDSVLPEKMRAKNVNFQAVYLFDISGDNGGKWTVSFDGNGGVEAKAGDDPSAQCTVSISDTNFVDMIEKKLNPQMAFMSGKLKIKGNMGLAMKLVPLIG